MKAHSILSIKANCEYASQHLMCTGEKALTGLLLPPNPPENTDYINRGVIKVLLHLLNSLLLLLRSLHLNKAPYVGVIQRL